MRKWQLLYAAGFAVVANPALASDPHLAPVAQAPASPADVPASERPGVQPAITVQVDGSESAQVQVGQLVHFAGIIQMPPDTGHVARAEWDFDGQGDFRKRSRIGGNFPTVIVTASHSFSRPGTYFPTLRVHTGHDGQTETSAPTFARVRVDVETR